MNYTDDDLVEIGRQLIIARRYMWDLERKKQRNSSFYREELALARREYRRLLAARKDMINKVQTRLTL